MKNFIFDFYGYFVFFYSLLLIVIHTLCMVASFIAQRREKIFFSIPYIKKLLTDSPYTPGISIVVPAFNEENSVIANVKSMLSPSLTKYFHPVWASAKLDLLTLSNNYYYNLSGQTKFFLNDDGRTNIQAMAGIGTFPEISIVDYSLIRNFSHTNTMVGLGGQWLVNKSLTLGILGT